MKRYITYQASIHGGEPLGEADSLEQAVNIGVLYGCKDPYCICEGYSVFDRKLKTHNINKMFHDEQREMKERIIG